MDKEKLLKALERMKIHYLAHSYIVSPIIMRKTKTMPLTEIKKYFKKVKSHSGKGWKWHDLHFLVTECYETGWNDAIDSIIKGLKNDSDKKL
jgi:hypothetical protein